MPQKCGIYQAFKITNPAENFNHRIWRESRTISREESGRSSKTVGRITQDRNPDTRTIHSQSILTEQVLYVYLVDTLLPSRRRNQVFDNKLIMDCSSGIVTP